MRTSQVDAFLEAHDSGLTDADKAVANGKYLQPTSLCYLSTNFFLDLLHAEPLK